MKDPPALVIFSKDSPDCNGETRLQGPSLEALRRTGLEPSCFHLSYGAVVSKVGCTPQSFGVREEKCKPSLCT